MGLFWHIASVNYHGTDIQAIFDSVNEWTAGVDPRYQGRIEAAGVTLIIGSGFIGVEMGAFFSGVGIDTKIFARGELFLIAAVVAISKVKSYQGN